MSAERTSHGSTATPSKEPPSNRGRDGRETAQDDSSTESDKEAPDYGNHVSHGKSRFLAWVGERRERVDGFDPDLSDLPELYEQWQADDEQADLGRWDA